MGKKTRGQTLTLGEFFAQTSTRRSSGLLGAGEGGSGGSGASGASDDVGRFATFEVEIGNGSVRRTAVNGGGDVGTSTSTSTSGGKYDVRCYVRAGRAGANGSNDSSVSSSSLDKLVREVEFTFGGGYGTK